MTAADGTIDGQASWRPGIAIVATALLALFVCATTAFGIVRSWSGVPYYDQWDGAIAFYLHVREGDYSAWWSPHNEHRVVVTRALMWADLAWFGGTDVPVQIADCLLLAVAAYTLWRMSRDIDPSIPRPRRVAFGLFVVAWLGLWVQKENLTSGFQSCFIAAQILPLCAFDRLARSGGSPRRFAFACLLGIASAGTMISGLLTLPLMAAQSFLSGQGPRRVATLVGLAMVVTLLYVVGLPAAVDATAARPADVTPIAFVQHLLYYLGGPFHFLLKEGLTGRVGATVAGATLIVVSAVVFVGVVRQQRPGAPALALALLAFIAYVLCSAAATSSGRSGFGAAQAFSSRYATPVLMAWAALAVLLAPRPITRPAWVTRARISAVVILALAMIRLQTEALKTRDDAVFDRRVAALALALQVDDRDRIRLIYPYPRHVLGIASRASAAHVALFGRFPLRDVEALVGTKAARGSLPTCTGRIDRIEPVSGDARHARVVGRMSDPSNRTPARIAFVDAQDDIVGFAIGGRKVDSIHDGFEGYVRVGDDAWTGLRGEQPDCALRIVGPG